MNTTRAKRPVPLSTAALSTAALSTMALLAALTACSAQPEPEAEPEAPADEPSAACEVGHWVLDVADFESQAVTFLEGNGIPITDYALTGDGQLDIADDGFIDGLVSLQSTGVLVPPGADPVPVDVASSYTFSGNWEPGETEGTIDLSNWAQVADVGVPVDETGAIPEFFDFTDIPTVSSDCTADSLRLQGPDAPLSALWHRA